MDPSAPSAQLAGSLKNVAQRLLDSVRFISRDEEGFDEAAAGQLRLGLDTS